VPLVLSASTSRGTSCKTATIVGLDKMNAYYDPALKKARRAELAKSNRLRLVKLDLADRDGMAALFKEHRFPYVVHLAAQAACDRSADGRVLAFNRRAPIDPFDFFFKAMTVRIRAAVL
jgi:nucleoside-diphosphate-sugar epimerase